jgi:hypothetical protein
LSKLLFRKRENRYVDLYGVGLLGFGQLYTKTPGVDTNIKLDWGIYVGLRLYPVHYIGAFGEIGVGQYNNLRFGIVLRI